MASNQEYHSGATENIMALAQSHAVHGAVGSVPGTAPVGEKQAYLYRYEINESYHVFEWANIMIERSGFMHPAASFVLRGVVRMEPPGSTNLLITAVGDTAMGQVANRITFSAEATITQDGELIDKKILTASPSGYILPVPDTSFTIGEATFSLPNPNDGTQIMAHIKGSYIANFDEGIASPRRYMNRLIPATAKKNFIVKKVLIIQ